MSGTEVFEVVDPGLLTTVQDLGRAGHGPEGITEGGAADGWSLAVANALVGNPPDAAALEITLIGPTLRALRPVTVGLAGTIAGRIVGSGTTVAPGTGVSLGAGATLRLDGPATGARGYLAIPGGVDVPVVLGSRSTALGAGFGGFDGRALRAGDRIRAGDPVEGSREAAAGDARATRDAARGDARATVTPSSWPVGTVAPTAIWPGSPAPEPGPVRFLPGPHADDLGAPALAALTAYDWIVDAASDRVGLRLAGPTLPGTSIGELASHGVIAGAIQLPPDRRPIVLLVDHQPTGGYPVLAVVIRADLPRLAQLAPGMSFRFVETTRNHAREALRARRRAYDAALTTMRDDARWDDLWRSAGAR
jgi:allophanate hydrolase subunit 2